jgi:asparagine synthase (glutamine-hydrolysing)
MCGIAGFIDFTSSSSCIEDQAAQVARMGNMLAHRGPDDSGEWVSSDTRVALAHRRLSILDVSPEGHQPMVSPSKRYIITYNGEVYNFVEIRDELGAAGYRFRGESDTEVILAAFDEWGIQESLSRFRGMCALAVYDQLEKVLTLVRDRLGIKPLYYGWSEQSFLFGSELKAIRVHKAFRNAIDRDVVGLYLHFNHIPCPYSIYERIFKLPPGCTLTIDSRKVIPSSFSAFPDDVSATHSPRSYWALHTVFETGLSSPLTCGEQEITDELNGILADAVARRMISDVPLGAFLSGGIDSSVVASLMQAASSKRIKTFTIAFEESRFSEASYARAVSEYLNTDHTEMTVTAKEALDIIPQLPGYYDEPFADSSQLPTLLLSLMTRRHVTVALSGDGGDELLAGYNRYRFVPSVWRRTRLVPYSLRRAMAWGIHRTPRRVWEWLGNTFAGTLPDALRSHPIADAAKRIGDVIDARDFSEAHRFIQCHVKRPRGLFPDYSPKPLLVDYCADSFPISYDHPIRQMLHRDLLQCLPDDMLTKVDRASMGCSLEVRVPLIDHRAVEFAARIPIDVMYRHGTGKRPLRNILRRHVPERLFDRPKSGFGAPVSEWLRGPLSEWANDLLSDARIRREGFFDSAQTRKLWQEHRTGRYDHVSAVWGLLMFQAWLDQWKGDAEANLDTCRPSGNTSPTRTS